MIYKKFTIIKKAIPIIILIGLAILIDSGLFRTAIIGLLAILLGRYTYTVYKNWDQLKSIYFLILAQEKARAYQKKMKYEEKGGE